MGIAYSLGYAVGSLIKYWYISLLVIAVLIYLVIKWKKGAKNGK